MERMLGRLHRVAQKELVQELQRWSDAVLHAASRMRFDCQNFLAKVLEEEADPLPLSENQRKQAGTQYHDASIREVERDGHELRQREDVDDAHPCLFDWLLQQFASPSTFAGWNYDLFLHYKHQIFDSTFYSCDQSVDEA